MADIVEFPEWFYCPECPIPDNKLDNTRAAMLCLNHREYVSGPDDPVGDFYTETYIPTHNGGEDGAAWGAMIHRAEN